MLITGLKIGNGQLIEGENLSVMRGLSAESVDLMYLDPPFFSQKNYADVSGKHCFSDKWEDCPAYIGWLNLRLQECRRLLKETGSIYVHCDWHANHYIRVELDKIFGYSNFRNEIVWHYRRMSGGGRFSHECTTPFSFTPKPTNLNSIVFYYLSPKRKFKSEKMDSLQAIQNPRKCCEFMTERSARIELRRPRKKASRFTTSTIRQKECRCLTFGIFP